MTGNSRDGGAWGEPVLQPRLMPGIMHAFNNMQAGVMGRLDMVLCGGVISARDARLLREAEEILERGRRVTDLILELSAGRVLRKTLTAPEAPLRRALASLRPELDWCEVQVALNLGGGICRVQEDLMTQAICHLLTNAICAIGSAERQRIEVDCGVEDDWLQVRVSDSGHGFSPEQLELLRLPLQEHQPGEATGRWRHRKRFGFGLFLTRWIAQVHGGTASFENRAGSGASCLLRIPADLTDEDVLAELTDQQTPDAYPASGGAGMRGLRPQDKDHPGASRQ